MAKTVTAKAGSFEAVTHERFLIMTAIHGGIKINWSRLLFDILKDMVTPSSEQAKGFAAQIFGVLLKEAPDLTLGDSKTFPPLKILTVVAVGIYVTKNKSVSTTIEEVMDELAVDKVVKAAVKRRPGPAAEPVAKKKRTTVGRAAPKEKDLSIVPVVQDAEPISVLPAGSPTVQTRKAPKRKLILQEETYEEEPDKKDEEKQDKETTTSEDTEPLSKVLRITETSVSDEESMAVDDILRKIPEDVMLPSTVAEEPTQIKFHAHHVALIKLLEQLRQHKLKWTRPSSSNLFGGDVDQSRGIHAQYQLVQDLDSRRPYSAIVQRKWAEICTDVVQFSIFGHLQPGKRVVEIRSLKIVADLEVEEEEVAMKLRREVVDRIKEEEVEALDLADGFLEFF
ncbi:hypothetical protein F511_18535 [Dorcoceras hygrometricum]|uniref:Splicing factor 3B subunit 1-like n=1 Tax=Dorcoceras hygrometricum TaxID=472368 RepID=A0A2Z7A3H3_9LAMI|nr:hypothetical protein F511_18535 [Dorcoceras hygrometricum]